MSGTKARSKLGKVESEEDDSTVKLRPVEPARISIDWMLPRGPLDRRGRRPADETRGALTFFTAGAGFD
jgi:hypothetical protein